MPGTRTSVANAANVVTLARIALVPGVVVALIVDTDGGWRLVAAGLFALAAATDRLDGYLARRMGQVTDWGTFVDPVADKLLIGATMVTLSVLGDLPWWVTAVVAVREIAVTVLRVAVVRYVVIPASRGGKLKTVMQSVGVGMFVLPLSQLPPGVTVLAWVILLVALVVTVATGIDYLRRGCALRRRS